MNLLPTDSVIVSREIDLVSREEQARWFAEEVQPHEPKLRHWLRRRFPWLHDVDDLVQESYARLFRAQRAGRFRQAKPYLYSTARNVAIDLCRHEQVVAIDRIAEMADLAVLDQRPDAAETASQAEELALLREAIRALPERCREVLVLRKLHGLSQKEIAQRLGLSENTVAAQASVGVRRCVEFFRARHVSR